MLLKSTNGWPILVDAIDFEWASKLTWHVQVNKNGNPSVVFRTDTARQLTHEIFHRRGISIPQDVDHADRNPLNNLRSNLRLATRTQNNANHGLQSNSTSGYKGVSFRKQLQKWRAYIKISGQSYELGTFSSPERAAKAYDKAAIRLFGEFACLNFAGSTQ